MRMSKEKEGEAEGAPIRTTVEALRTPKSFHFDFVGANLDSLTGAVEALLFGD